MMPQKVKENLKTKELEYLNEGNKEIKFRINDMVNCVLKAILVYFFTYNRRRKHHFIWQQ